MAAPLRPESNHTSACNFSPSHLWSAPMRSRSLTCVLKCKKTPHTACLVDPLQKVTSPRPRSAMTWTLRTGQQGCRAIPCHDLTTVWGVKLHVGYPWSRAPGQLRAPSKTTADNMRTLFQHHPASLLLLRAFYGVSTGYGSSRFRRVAFTIFRAALLVGWLLNE